MFNKNGEVKVYKKDLEVSPKVANEDESNRYTVDDLVKDSEQEKAAEKEEEE